MEADYRRTADVLADCPAAVANALELAAWCAAMAAGYRANGEHWLPF